MATTTPSSLKGKLATHHELVTYLAALLTPVGFAGKHRHDKQSYVAEFNLFGQYSRVVEDFANATSPADPSRQWYDNEQSYEALSGLMTSNRGRGKEMVALFTQRVVGELREEYRRVDRHSLSRWERGSLEELEGEMERLLVQAGEVAC